MDTALSVFIELPSPMDSEPEIVLSRCFDISANGLRVIADRELPTGCILRACVQLQQQQLHALPVATKQTRFTLISEAKWAEPHGAQGEWLTGLSLYESEDSDIADWKAFVGMLYLL